MNARIHALLTLSFVLSSCLWAGPLQKGHVAADAKWLVHLDLDNFRGTKLGGFLIREFLEKKLAELKAHSGFKFDLAVGKINSVTAYGADFQSKPEANAVLIIKTDAKTQKDVEAVLQGQVAADAEGKIRKLQDQPHATYSVHGGLLISFPSVGFVILGKSQAQIQTAGEVMAGRAANLTASKTFAEFPSVSGGFFFLGMAEGFNEDAAIPPQAKVLKMANGGRLIAGESGEKLFLDLVLKVKSLEVSQQIQQIVQGMIALAALSQTENQELQQLAQSIKVAANEKMVTLGLEFPVSRALEHLGKAAQRQNNFQ